MSGAGLTVAVVGLGFGADFIPIYLSRPDVDRVLMVPFTRGGAAGGTVGP